MGSLLRASILLLGAFLLAGNASAGVTVTPTTVNGNRLAYKVESERLSFVVLNRGAAIYSLHVPDKKGDKSDVVLGYADQERYKHGGAYFGVVVGRVANRIEKGKLVLDGKEYSCTINNGPNSLHGGEAGFGQKEWTCKPIKDGVELCLRTFDGEEGYPGNVNATVVYRIKGDSLKVEMKACADRRTPINMAQHSYFNLAGHNSGTILGHKVSLAAEAYLPVDDVSIPTGEVIPVQGTEMDFSEPVEIGVKMNEMAKKRGLNLPFDPITKMALEHAPEVTSPGGPQSGAPLGFDHNWCLKRCGPVGKFLRGGMRKVATVEDPKTGRTMSVETDQPGVQFYTGNFCDGVEGKDGASYMQHAGLCLETQAYPNSVGIDASSPLFEGACPIIEPGKDYKHTVVYKFGTTK